MHYTAGSLFHLDNSGSSAHMLCRVGIMEYCLVSLDTGNRWLEPVKVESVEQLTLQFIQENLVGIGLSIIPLPGKATV